VDIFLTFILINFLVRTRKSAETLILGFCAHKDKYEKKPLPKLGYFSKNGKIIIIKEKQIVAVK
jgi:hypothetical protein